MGKRTYAEMLPETVVENVGKLGENKRSREGEREGTVRNLEEWAMILVLKNKYLFPPKAPPLGLVFLERRESEGGVLNSFLEKRVINSDSFTTRMKEPKSGGNWRGKIYSDNTIVNLSMTCSVYYRTDLTR